MNIALGERTHCGGNNVRRSATQFLRDLPQQLKIVPGGSFCAAPAHKFDAPVLAHLRAIAHQYHADLARAFDVGSSAWLQVGRFDFIGGKYTFPLDSFSSPKPGELLLSSLSHL